MLTLRSRAYVWPTLIFLGAGFALANGLSYSCGNLRQYLLHAMHSLDPTFLANDWFTTQTRPHHAAFNALLTWAGLLMPLDVFFGLANALMAAVFVLCIYLLAARYYQTPILVTALTVFLWVLGPRTWLGLSYLLNDYFQPSTVGAVGLLAGLTCLVYGRYRLAGLVFLIASLFHINYMVWIAVILPAVVVVNFRRMGRRNAAFLLLSLVPAAVSHLPFFLAARSPEQTAHSLAAAHILHDIYMPCHSRPLTWSWQPFLRFATMLAAGGLALGVIRPTRSAGRITLSILCVVAAILAVGMFLSMVVQIDAMALLFPYRLTPLLALAAQIAVAGALATTALQPNISPLKTVALWLFLGGLLYCAGLDAYALLCLGVIMVAVFAGGLAQETSCSTPHMLALLAALAICLRCCGAGTGSLALVVACILGAACWRLTRSWRPTQLPWTRLLLFGGAAVPLLVAMFLTRIGSARKDFLGPALPADERLLYDWCSRQSRLDDAFIIPPLLNDFRLEAHRSVVIDWKCMPILPRDTVEWYDRLADECGTRFDSLPEAERGYAGMDAGRARRLARTYHARYLVVERDHDESRLGDLTRVYSNPSFAVFDLVNASGRQAMNPVCRNR